MRNAFMSNKNRESEKRELNVPKIVGNISAVITLLSLALLLINQFVFRIFGIMWLNEGIRDNVFIAAIVFFVGVVYVKLDAILKIVSGNEREMQGIIDVRAAHDSIDFAYLLQHNKHIKLLTLSGTKTGTLGDKSVIDSLNDKNRKSEIKILLGNPFSQAIITRYECDEPDSFETGLLGLERRLKTLHTLLNELPEYARNKIEIRVFDNYPVVTVVQADDDMYSSAYAYKMRGADCPIVHAKTNSNYGAFLCNHFDGVFKDSISLREWYERYAKPSKGVKENE